MSLKLLSGSTACGEVCPSTAATCPRMSSSAIRSHSARGAAASIRASSPLAPMPRRAGARTTPLRIGGSAPAPAARRNDPVSSRIATS